MNLGLKGKRAIVTGGSRGIGKAVIDTFIEEGMQIATCSRNVKSLENSLAQWNKGEANVIAESVDVTDEKAFTAWFNNSVAQLGGLDVFVSNVSTRVESGGLERWK